MCWTFLLAAMVPRVASEPHEHLAGWALMGVARRSRWSVSVWRRLYRGASAVPADGRKPERQTGLCPRCCGTKYYIDELYDFFGSSAASRRVVLWKVVDNIFIDGGLTKVGPVLRW